MSADHNRDVEECASAWLARRDSGAWSDADQARLEQWLAASTLNRVTFLRLELAWEESARLKALGAGVPDDRPPPRGHWNLSPFPLSPFPNSLRAPAQAGADLAGRHPRSRRGPGYSAFLRHLTRHWHLAIASSLLLALAVGVGAHWARLGGERFTTTVGGLASVSIADGSKITLNTDSRVHVKLTKSERRIELDRGEAFFEVAKDRDRPFVVDAGGRRIEAVGTKFSVRRNSGSVEVIVTEGRVRVDETVLTAGMIGLAGEDGLLVQRKNLEDAELHLSWRRGVLMFRELPLYEAAAELNRYNVRKLVVADPAVGELKVEGNFRPTNVMAFVRLLEAGFPVRAEIEDDRIVLSAR